MPPPQSARVKRLALPSARVLQQYRYRMMGVTHIVLQDSLWSTLALVQILKMMVGHMPVLDMYIQNCSPEVTNMNHP